MDPKMQLSCWNKDRDHYREETHTYNKQVAEGESEEWRIHIPLNNSFFIYHLHAKFLSQTINIKDGPCFSSECIFQRGRKLKCQIYEWCSASACSAVTELFTQTQLMDFCLRRCWNSIKQRCYHSVGFFFLQHNLTSYPGPEWLLLTGNIQ